MPETNLEKGLKEIHKWMKINQNKIRNFLMKYVIITGSSGLVGSETSVFLGIRILRCLE